MKVMRFAARSARDALAQLRQALGEDAVVLSTRPCAEGVEVLALEPEGLARIEQAAVQADRARAVRAAPQPEAVSEPGLLRSAGLAERIGAGSESPKAQPNRRREPSLDAAPTAGRDTSSGWDTEPSQDPVARDVETLGMSTLSFQDYVRERMLKRRQAELTQQAAAQPAGAVATARPVARLAQVGAAAGQGEASVGEAAPAPQPARQPTSRREPPVLRDEIRTMALGQPGQPAESNSLPAAEPAALRPTTRTATAPLSATPRERSELIVELRAVRELIDERFGMLAFLERLQRDPRQAKLSQQLFEAAFSPALVRKLVQSLPTDAADPLAWASGVLEHNLLTDEQGLAIEDHRGVFALIGATGVGKTTSTAKLAAAFATKHGAAALGLITLDAYRVAAHEQLRTYGRILGVPVHTAHDRASLEDLLELLSAKTLVLIDTAGMAQRDARTRELLEMLQHRSISKLLVISAAAQGETLEDVMLGYGVQQCLGVIVSKLDEAVKLGPALDALIRYRAKVVAVANGQRVPEDWHRLSSQALVQRALRGGGGNSWRLDAGEVNLLFAATQGGGYPGPQGLVPQV
jgi:flagellar biosynthesis protein FlhF